MNTNILSLRARTCAILSSLTLLASGLGASPNPSPVRVFTPSTTISVLMRTMDQNGNDTGANCLVSSTEKRFGCTADSTRAYPYTSNPVSVNIEGDYLLDLVSKEFSPGLYTAAPATEAFVIAARSYTHYYNGNPDPPASPGSVTNTTSYHVFIPYMFEMLSNTQGFSPNNAGDVCASTNLVRAERLACNGVAVKKYFGLSSSDLPAKALYTADWTYQTANGTNDKPYLVSVQEPISTNKCDANNDGHGWGLSQEGASRWALGVECSRANAPVLGGNTAGGTWSVRWSRSDQIIFHYYTNVHMRNLTNQSILSPDYRWVPLEISWNGQRTPPKSITPGTTFSLSLRVQNVGTQTWSCPTGTTFLARVRWLKGTNTPVTIGTINVCNLAPGDSMAGMQTVSGTIPSWGRGFYGLVIDLERTGSAPFVFSGQSLAWPQYVANICSNDCFFTHAAAVQNFNAPSLDLGGVAGYP